MVDATGFVDHGWLDGLGHPHSDALHLTERFHRRDFGHMDVRVTIDDSKTYSGPFTYAYTQLLLPDTDLIESFCNENEKDRAHIGQK